MGFDEIQCNRMRSGANWLDFARFILFVSIWLISAPFSSNLVDSTRLGSIWLDSARFGSIGTYLALFGAIRLYSTLFCSIHLCSTPFHTILHYSVLRNHTPSYPILIYSVLFYSVLF